MKYAGNEMKENMDSFNKLSRHFPRRAEEANSSTVVCVPAEIRKGTSLTQIRSITTTTEVRDKKAQ
jgi:hypothetical protein